MTSRSARRCLWQVTALLVAVNVGRALGILGPAWLSAVLLVCGCAALAIGARARPADLGLAAADVSSGLRYGVLAAGAVLMVLLAAAALPMTNGFVHDARGDVPASRLLYDVLVVVVLLTAIPEELAFRGVLLGSAMVAWGERRALVVSSALFGLWHVAPTLHTMHGNHEVSGLAGSSGGRVLVVTGAVLATFAAGLVFGWLRLRSRSLVAPVVAHVATNGFGFIVAWFATH